MLSILNQIKDIPEFVQFVIDMQNEKGIQSHIPVKYEDMANWFYLCVESPSVEILYSISTRNNPVLDSRTENEVISPQSGDRTKNEIDGFLVLSESVYPWNNEKKFGTDLMFLCRRNGIKLINLAKKIAKKRNWESLILSTSCNDERVDKFMTHICKQKIGGVYDV